MAGEKNNGGKPIAGLNNLSTTSSTRALNNTSPSLLTSGKNITNLQHCDKLLKMEKKVLEAKESYVDANLAKLFEDTFKSLKAWKSQLQNREKGLIEKADRVNNFIKRTREVYGYNDPESGGTGGKSLKDNCACLKSRESSADGDMPQSTPEDKGEESGGEDEIGKKNRKVKIVENKKLKTHRDHTRRRNTEQMKKDEEEDILMEKQMEVPEELREDQLLDGDANSHGWTIPKIQRLYLRYCRAESFRKALAYQKRYLTLTSPPRKPKTLNKQRKLSFKSISYVVVALIRMKFLVGRYHQRIEICSTVKKRKSATARKKNKPLAHTQRIDREDEENDGSYLATRHVETAFPRQQPLTTKESNTPSRDRRHDYTSSTTDSSGCHSAKGRLPTSIKKPLATNINKSYPKIPSSGKSDSDVSTLWNFHWKPISPITPKTRATDPLLNSYPRCIAERDGSEDPGYLSVLRKEEKLLGEAEVSLSSYMQTLDDLQTKLKLISS